MKRSVPRVLLALFLPLFVACVAACAQTARPWQRPGTKVGDEIVGPDGGKMVWAPAGEFMMGSTDAEVEAVYRRLLEANPNQQRDWLMNEYPAHGVRITKGLWLGKCTVTNAQYRQYCRDTGVDFPKKSDQGDNHPVTWVDWAEAQAYCKHYGLSLPTEAQWEYAARGPEGHRYPWGDEWDPDKCCNAVNTGPGGKTFPVGSFPQGASWCGALDMAGNVWQWCRDWYSRGYYANSPETDPPGPENGEDRVLRGGKYALGDGACRSMARGDVAPTAKGSGAGFRCVALPD